MGFTFRLLQASTTSEIVSSPSTSIKVSSSPSLCHALLELAETAGPGEKTKGYSQLLRRKAALQFLQKEGY